MKLPHVMWKFFVFSSPSGIIVVWYWRAVIDPAVDVHDIFIQRIQYSKKSELLSQPDRELAS